MNKNKIVIFGASGFLGKHLCSFLIKNNYDIIAFVRSKEENKLNILNKKKIKLIECGDLTEIKFFNFNFKNIECIINCAAKAHVQNKININECEYVKKLINIEKNIINNVKDKNIRIIQISSAKVLKKQLNKKNNSIDIYTKAKICSEKLIKNNFKKYIILRPPIIYGPNVKANFLSIMKLISLNIPLPLLGINNSRSYLFIENLLDVILKIIKNKKIVRKTYYLSDGKNLSTLTLGKLIAKYLSKRTVFFHFNKRLLDFFLKLIGKNDIIEKVMGDFVVDNNKISKDLNWKPKVKIEEGIKKTCFWYKRRFNIQKR